MASLGRESFPGGTAFCAVARGNVMGQPGDVEEASRKAMGTSSGVPDGVFGRRAALRWLAAPAGRINSAYLKRKHALFAY